MGALGIVLAIGATALLASHFAPKRNGAYSHISFSGTYISPANNIQHQATIQLCAFDGKLYYVREKCGFTDHRPYAGWLCVFEGGEVKPVIKLSHNSYLSVCGVIGEYLYYREFNGSFEEDELYCYSFQSGKLDKLSSEKTKETHPVIREDGSLLIALSTITHKPQAYLRLKGGAVVGITEEEREWSYRLGDREYFIKDEPDVLQGVVYCRDSSGEVTAVPLEWADNRSLIPLDNGLLVHNRGWRHLLYYISESGEVRDLFDADCYRSNSAMTVYRDTVFFSVKRYQNGGDFGASGSQSIPDDARSGTYRINLADYTMEKISDMVYTGMFIFDDTGIYACDSKNNIWKLDFDGNVVDTLT